jgi:toxin secretion/phage lysis holin
MDHFSVSKFSISAAAGVISAFGVYIFGEWSNDILALIVLMVIDFIMGLLLAIIFQKSPKSKKGGLSSAAAWKGIAKKTCTILLVAVAYQADILLTTEYIRPTVVGALCASEIISIVENAAKMGILPEPVQKLLNKVIDILNVPKGDGGNE